jgi:hypothetical protein
MSNIADVCKGVNAINPLVAFYDIHGKKRELLFFYFVPDTTRDKNINTYGKYTLHIYILALLCAIFLFCPGPHTGLKSTFNPLIASSRGMSHICFSIIRFYKVIVLKS